VLLTFITSWKSPKSGQGNIAGAKAFADFIVSQGDAGHRKIYGVDKYGSPLFFPDAGKKWRFGEVDGSDFEGIKKASGLV